MEIKSIKIYVAEYRVCILRNCERGKTIEGKKDKILWCVKYLKKMFYREHYIVVYNAPYSILHMKCK